MRRYISLACVALIVVTCMVSPVSASSFSSVGFVDLLDYGYIILNGNDLYDCRILLYNDSGTFYFPSYLSFPSGKFELLIRTNDSGISFSNLKGAACVKTASDLGSGYYVVTGDFDGSGSGLNYYSTRDNGYCFIVSAKCLPLGYSVAEIPFDFQVYDAADGELLVDQKQVVRYEYEDDPYFTDSDNAFERQIRIYPNKDDLRGLDYFDFDFYIQNVEIDSISASFGGNALDVQYTTSFIGDGVLNNNVASGDAGSDKTYGIYKVVLRVDVSGISLLDGLPTIFITYNANNFYGFQPYFYAYGINAGKEWSATDSSVFYSSRILVYLKEQFPILTSLITTFSNNVVSQFSQLKTALSGHFSNLNSWITTQTTAIQTQFTQLKSALSTHFSNLDSWLDTQTDILEAAIRGDTSPGDSFQDEVDQKDQQLNDMAAVMDSVDRPDLNSVNVSADSYVDGTVLSASMSGITAVIGAPVFLDVIMMSLIMATAGYVLFGKR